MSLDAIHANDPAAAADAVSVRPASDPRVTPRKEKTPPPQSAQPVANSRPVQRDEVNVKWDRDDGVIVTFTDRDSGEVFRQIPSEQVLSVVRFIRQMLNQQFSATESEQRF